MHMHNSEGTERRAQVRPLSSILGQYEPWTEPQLNLSENLTLLRTNSLKFQPLYTQKTLPPKDSTLSKDARIEPRTVATIT
jgi:hypothetical protein